MGVQYETIYVEYYSREWELLVETGWRTMTVDLLSDGTQIARMIRG